MSEKPGEACQKSAAARQIGSVDVTSSAGPQTYDLTRDDYAFRPVGNGQQGHISCWNGINPRPGDYLIMRNGNQSSRYQVVSADPCFGVDPPTMWMADLVFAPRT